MVAFKRSGLLGSSGVPRESPLAAPGVTGPALEFQEVDRVAGPPLALLRLWLTATAAQEVCFAFRAEAEASVAEEELIVLKGLCCEGVDSFASCFCWPAWP